MDEDEQETTTSTNPEVGETLAGVETSAPEKADEAVV